MVIVMNEKTETETFEAPPVNHDQVLLAQFGLDQLPEVFAMRDGDQIIQERAPCYRCAADGFYGLGTSGTWYEEGSIIVLDSTPNHQLEPLNRAAALRWAKWLQSLPTTRATFDIGDMAEAAQMLSKNPKVHALDPIAYQASLIKLCEELKIRREGKDARTLPGMSAHNFAPSSGRSGAAPILGAKVAQMAERGPGNLHGTNAGPNNAGRGGARRAGNAPVTGQNTLGGAPPIP
jgi:hypothetical protein